MPASRAGNAWFTDNEGPLYFRRVTGDFVAETSATLGTSADLRTTPTRPGAFSGAGFVVRDPSSARGRARWVMYDIGYQDSAVALEIKTTTPGTGTTPGSRSTLYLNDTPSATNTARLRVCRVGDSLRFFHRYASESTWTEERFNRKGAVPTRVIGNGPRPERSENAPLRFDRPDLPSTVQLGLMVGVWSPDQAGTRGVFDYVRVARVRTPRDCVAGLTP